MSWVDNPGDWLIYLFLLSGVLVGPMSSSQLQAILSLPCGHLHLRVVHLDGLIHLFFCAFPGHLHRAQGRMSMTQGSWGLSQLKLGIFQQFLHALHVERGGAAGWSRGLFFYPNGLQVLGSCYFFWSFISFQALGHHGVFFMMI